jgi:hypothetical protein
MARRRHKTQSKPMKTEAERIDELADACGVPKEQRHGLVRQSVHVSVEPGGEEKCSAIVLVNRGGTAVERWMSNDKIGMFDEPQQRAIRYTQALWSRADGKLRAVDLTRDIVDEVIDGMSQQEALDELSRFKKHVPRRFWDVFENVCRFDEEAGVAGSRLATNARSAIDAAKTTVAFTASMIAQWRGM